VTRWRLIEDGPLAPARNMAVDEALLERFAPGDAPVLRLYRWRPAALSLGRFQPLASLAHLPAEIARVRRLTGGGAIYHREDEVTYAIVAPYELFSGKRAGPRAAYFAVHAAIARGLESLGLRLPAGALGGEPARGHESLCYDLATEFDLKAAGGKLVGSAQRRRGHAFLQHGSVPLSPDPFAHGATSLEQALGRRPEPAEVAAAIRAGIAGELGAELAPCALADPESALADDLERERYASGAWTAGSDPSR
jgi:lipoate-protein ligase A